MQAYNISAPAYIKSILHAHKYAFSPVCGILIGQAEGEGEGNKVDILDAIPLFHTIPLAPLFEVAMLQVFIYFRHDANYLLSLFR